MSSPLDNIMKMIIRYRNEQGWQNNDQPNNLVKSIFIESTELLRNFLFETNPYTLENIKEEIADVLMYSLALTHDLGFSAEKLLIELLEKDG